MPATDPARDPRDAPRGTHRLFFALWPAPAVRDALAAAARAVPAFADAGRPTADAKLHLTLHFLGGWDAFPDAVALRARASAATVEARGFHLVVDHAGSFRASRVGWLAPSGNSGLDALWSELGRALDAEEVPRRAHPRFSPHVTVLRGLGRAVPEAPVEPVSWPVEDFVLVHSHAGRYEVIDRWPLQPAG